MATTDLPATVAEAAGMLPEDHYDAGVASACGWDLKVSEDLYMRAAVCRALAKSLGHEGAEAYWLARWEADLGAWALVESADRFGHEVSIRRFRVDADTPAAALIAIAHARASEAGEAG